jgi:outer membrane protein assembly factor BamB
VRTHLFFGLVLIVSLFVVSGCKKNSGTTNPATDAGVPQQQIAWPSLANAAWPIARHDAQGTGRSQYRGPQLGRVKASFHSLAPATCPIVGPDSLLYFGAGSALVSATPSGIIAWSLLLSNRTGIDPGTNPPVLLSDGNVFFGVTTGGAITVNRSDTATRVSIPMPGKIMMRQIGISKNGVIFAGGGIGTPSLYAIASGSIVWSKTAPSGYFNVSEKAGIAFSPDGATMYIPGMTTPSLFALDLNGNLLWSDSLSGGIVSALSVDNAGNIFGWTSKSLVSIAPDGSLRWSKPTTSSNWDVTIDNQGNIAYLMDGKLNSVTNDGKDRWSLPLDGGDFYVPIISDVDGTIYCVTGTTAPNTYTVRAVTSAGVVKWSTTITAYMKDGGLALTSEGLLVITDTGGSSTAPIPNTIYIIE